MEAFSVIFLSLKKSVAVLYQYAFGEENLYSSENEFLSPSFLSTWGKREE
jgi:hypothetical protein